jgi:uncharacterized protein (TIGR03000 family)
MVMGVIITLTINTASAQWAHHGRGNAGCGQSGQGYNSMGYGSLGYGSSGGGFAGGSSGGEQSSRRLFGRIHNHHAMRRESRQAVGYGSCGGYGSSGYGSSGGYGSAGYGARSGYAMPNPRAAYPTPNYSQSATKARIQPRSSTLANALTVNNTTIRFTVELESDTKLYINDKLTTSPGSVRQFLSSNLTPGKSYQFNLRADSMGSDGKLHSQTRELTVRAGERISIKFLPQDQYTNVVASNESQGKHELH